MPPDREKITIKCLFSTPARVDFASRAGFIIKFPTTKPKPQNRTPKCPIIVAAMNSVTAALPTTPITTSINSVKIAPPPSKDDPKSFRAIFGSINVYSVMIYSSILLLIVLLSVLLMLIRHGRSASISVAVSPKKVSAPVPAPAVPNNNVVVEFENELYEPKTL